MSLFPSKNKAGAQKKRSEGSARRRERDAFFGRTWSAAVGGGSRPAAPAASDLLRRIEDQPAHAVAVGVDGAHPFGRGEDGAARAIGGGRHVGRRGHGVGAGTGCAFGHGCRRERGAGCGLGARPDFGVRSSPRHPECALRREQRSGEQQPAHGDTHHPPTAPASTACLAAQPFGLFLRKLGWRTPSVPQRHPHIRHAQSTRISAHPHPPIRMHVSIPVHTRKTSWSPREREERAPRNLERTNTYLSSSTSTSTAHTHTHIRPPATHIAAASQLTREEGRGARQRQRSPCSECAIGGFSR
jgi:hypothetical protein